MGKKILLADDSITIQKVIELTFSDEDFEVVTVGNGRLAIERVQDVRPDVVLCDIIMPEKDGYEVCDFIKRHPQLGHVPVLLLTGAFEPFDQERATRVGCDGFLAKPFEPQTLIAKVKDLLAQSAPKRAPVAPSRPVAAAAAAAPTPPPMPPFGGARAPVAAPPQPAPPPAAAAPSTSPSGVPSPLPRHTPAQPPAAPEPAATLGSEFEVFYPTPDEIAPLAASPEFEPVFAPSDFEAPAEYDTVEVPVIEVPAPEPTSAAPSFIPDEPFGDELPPTFEAPPGVTEASDELFISEPSGEETPGVAASEAVPLRWSEPRAGDEAAYGIPAPPPTFEESFEEPSLTLEAESESVPPVPAPVASRSLGPDELVSDALFAGEPEPAPAQAGVAEARHAGVPLSEPLPELEAEAEPSDGGLFTALAEEDAGLIGAQPAAGVDELLPEAAETSFSETEPALALEGAEIEPGALELEPEAEAQPEAPALEARLEAAAPAVVEFEAPSEPRIEAAAEPEPMPEALMPEPPPAAPVSEEVSFEDIAPAPAAAPAPPSAAAAVTVPVEMVEQIARRVVAQLGDKVIREVAWEVVPDLAEALIRREIDRLKAELERLP